MTPVTASLDAVDRAFLWHADQTRRRPSRPPQSHSDNPLSPMPAATSPSLVSAAPVPATAVHGQPIIRQPIVDDGVGSIVDRLLRIVPHALSHLADRVEDAHRDGAEVIAITGARRGEGRTTLVECLARMLSARGRRVECHDRVPLAPVSGGRDGGGIVLVDPGVWFPGGPLRMAWLQRQSLGCHAVILVRRIDQPACDARGTALEAVGLRVLGEVLTMTPPTTSGILIS